MFEFFIFFPEMDLSMRSFFRDPEYLKDYVVNDAQAMSPEVASAVLDSKVNFVKVDFNCCHVELLLEQDHITYNYIHLCDKADVHAESSLLQTFLIFWYLS